MKTFLNDLRVALKSKNISAIEIEDIIADHQEMIEEAMQEGLSEDEIVSKFGSPETIAEALKDIDLKTEPDKGHQELEVWKKFEVVGEVIEIDVDLLSENVVYQKTQESTINVLFKGEKSLEKYNLEFNNNKLSLKVPKHTEFLSFLMKRRSMQFVIEMPEAVKIKDLKHSIVSGDILLSDLNIANLEFNTVSGDVGIKALKLGTVRWYTVSGDIDAKNINAESIKSSQVSGDLTLSQSEITSTIDIDSVSGDTKLSNVKTDTCILNSVSGTITGKEFYPNKVSLNSISGDIIIQNKEKRSIKIISKKSISGNILIKS